MLGVQATRSLRLASARKNIRETFFGAVQFILYNGIIPLKLKMLVLQSVEFVLQVLLRLQDMFFLRNHLTKSFFKGKLNVYRWGHGAFVRTHLGWRGRGRFLIFKHPVRDV